MNPFHSLSCRHRGTAGCQRRCGDRPKRGGHRRGPREGDATTTTIDRSALDALRAEELALSKADAECSAETTGPVLEEVRPEYEQRFLDSHPELANQAEG